LGRVAQAIAGLLQRSLVTRVYHSGHFEWIFQNPSRRFGILGRFRFAFAEHGICRLKCGVCGCYVMLSPHSPTNS
jgi:hypothetical protein